MTTGEGNKSTEGKRRKLWKERSSREGRRIRSGRASKQVGKWPLLKKIASSYLTRWKQGRIST